MALVWTWLTHDVTMPQAIDETGGRTLQDGLSLLLGGLGVYCLLAREESSTRTATVTIGTDPNLKRVINGS